MRNRFIGFILAVVAVLAISPAILAQTAGQSGAAKAQSTAPTPDLSGVWFGQSRDFNQQEPPQMQPWAEEEFKALRERLGPRGIRRIDFDPAITLCAPPGFPRILYHPEPMEIFQIPGRVLMLFEVDHWVRQIWMDGRGHPEDPDPTWMGHSIGRWDGDTLVVDTIGLQDNGLTWLNTTGHPHTGALHVVERYRRVDHDTLMVELTFDDPKTYTKSWKSQFPFQLKPDWEIGEYLPCEEHLGLIPGTETMD